MSNNLNEEKKMKELENTIKLIRRGKLKSFKLKEKLSQYSDRDVANILFEFRNEKDRLDKIVKAMDFNQLLKAVDVLIDFFDGYQVDVLDYLQMTISKRSEKISVASTKTVFEKSVVESISRNIDIPKIYFSHLLENPLIVDNDAFYIFVHDEKKFYSLLDKIVHKRLVKENDSKETRYRTLTYRSMVIMMCLWLRMGNDDFDQVEEFLEKELNFLEDETFSYAKDGKNMKYLGYDVWYQNLLGNDYDETWYKMKLVIENEKGRQSLPNILYGIREEDLEKVCYVYAIQNGKDNEDSKGVVRDLYHKLNKSGVLYTSHPKFRMALLSFYQILLDNDIHTIKVPRQQVMSLRFHQLLSDDAINNPKTFSNKSNFVGKAEQIEKNKTLGLQNLFLSTMDYTDFSVTVNEDETNSDYLTLYIDKNVKTMDNVVFQKKK